MIDFDFSTIHKCSVIDTCAILNLLSSSRFYTATINETFFWCYTSFVEYEVFYKSVKKETSIIIKQRQQLREETRKKRFRCEHLSISDLQEIEILENRKKLGKGELSSIAFARKTQLAFMTDDIKARKLGEAVLGVSKTLTTPRLWGWLYFNRILTDSDHKTIIEEHETQGRGMSEYYQEIYEEAMRRLCTCKIGV